MRLPAILLALALTSCSSNCRCHSGHTEICYRAAYSTTQYHKVGETSFPITTHHPAACYSRWVCDVRCSDWDKGQPEAHQEHTPHTTAMAVDPRCEYDSQGGWRVK